MHWRCRAEPSPRMPIRCHHRLEFGKTCNVAHAFILDMHLHVEPFRKRQQIFNGLSQVIQAVVIVSQITKNAQAAGAENLRRRESLGVSSRSTQRIVETGRRQNFLNCFGTRY